MNTLTNTTTTRIHNTEQLILYLQYDKKHKSQIYEELIYNRRKCCYVLLKQPLQSKRAKYMCIKFLEKNLLSFTNKFAVRDSLS